MYNFATIINRSRNCFAHNSCNNNFDKQLMYFHNNFLVHITIWKCKNKCVLLILFNVAECAQEVLITDTTPFVLVNIRKSLGFEFSLTFLYIDTRMLMPFNCQYNPNIGFLTHSPREAPYGAPQFEHHFPKSAKWRSLL